MINDQQTPEAVYIYNVTQEQIPLIKQKYYPEETRPLIAVNNTAPKESRWIHQYDLILQETYTQSRGNIDFIVPLFNMAIYEFDEEHSRKARRFEGEELKQKFTGLQREEDRRQKSIEVLDQLD